MTLADRSALTGLIDPSRDPRAVLGLVMLSFDGRSVPASVRERMASAPAAGVTLYRGRNAAAPDVVRALTDDLVAAAGGPLLIAADQEGGQLDAFSDGATAFPGAMALGAVGDELLAERVGAATGLELRAMGVNVCYAPVLDLATDPAHPALGIRSFGSDPAAVSRLGAATIRGLAASGVAATAKHFPGSGGLVTDSHHRLGLIAHDRERFHDVELAPFRAAIGARVPLVMSGHVSVPALTGRSDVPATLSRAVLHDLLRDELGFDGLVITDALDMGALAQGSLLIVDVLAAIAAGVDLLLLGDPADRDDLEAGLVHAARRGLVDRAALAASLGRIDALRSRLAGIPVPDPSIVGSPAHRELARAVAERSITLVRDDAGLIPLRLDSNSEILAVMPEPADLTPADTSSSVQPGLADAMRRHHPRVRELVVPQLPTDGEIAAVRQAAADADLVVLGTISASLQPAQAALARAVVEVASRTVTVALRAPFDLWVYPSASTHLCAYGIRPPTLAALARVMFGELAPTGRLPAPIPDLYPVGWRHAID